MIHTTQECRIGDALKLAQDVPDASIDLIATSPPYWGLRDYGVEGQIGLEPTMEEYHEKLLDVTAECMRVLKPTGVMFWNHGDSYGGNQGRGAGKGIEYGQMVSQKNTASKCLAMQNERLIIKMIDQQGWILRNRIIWNKPNGMPSSVEDRFSNKYEPVYMLVKSKKYWFDLDAVRVPHAESSIKRVSQNNGNPVFNGNKQRGHPAGQDTLNPNQFCHQLGKNPGDVWTIPTQPYSEAHFATFPTALIEPMIKAACPAEICSVCGMARERIVDRKFVPQQDVSEDKGIRGANDQKPLDTSNKWQNTPRGTTTHHTVGWTSCDCGAGWIAGTVLDPFAGSGTVGEEARKLNRNAILFELNPEYEPLIRERTMADTPPLTSYF